jgi:hypothetical protein
MMISEWQVGKDLEESGHGLIFGTTLAFAWRNWQKPQKITVRIPGLQAEIWTQDFPNMK